MKIDTNLTLLCSSEIREEIARLQTAIDLCRAELEARKEEETALLRAEIARKAAEIGVDPSALVASLAPAPAPVAAPAKKTRAPGIPKYRDPADPNKTWTGRGKRPAWLVQCLEDGMTLDSLLIEQPATWDVNC